MIFTNPQPITYTNEVKHRGVLDRHLAPDLLARNRPGVRFQLCLLSRMRSGRRLLDFGCGAGALVHEAIHIGWDAVGLDLNEGLVAAANRHWGFEALFSGTIDEFAAGGHGLFDVIVSDQVFEHLQDPLGVGRTLVSLLRPGGVLYLDVPNARQPGEWSSRGSTLDPTSHWNHFTLETLADLMARLAFKVIYRSAAPSLVRLYHRLGLKNLCYPLGMLSKRVLPPIGTGVCVIGRKLNG